MIRARSGWLDQFVCIFSIRRANKCTPFTTVDRREVQNWQTLKRVLVPAPLGQNRRFNLCWVSIKTQWVWFQNSFPREICNLRTKDLGFSCAVLTAYKVGVFLFSRMLSLVFLRAGTNRVQKVIPNCFALASFYSVIGLEKHATLYETKN